MVSTQNTQSLTDFRQKAAETLERINRTGEAEILTVNGEARAVLLSPAAYDEMNREAQVVRDVDAIRRSVRELDAGKGTDAEVVFDRLRAELIALKAKGRKANSK